MNHYCCSCVPLTLLVWVAVAQVNSAPARGPDHFPFQGIKDSGIGSQGIRNSLLLMTKVKSTVINLPQESYAMG
jgi:glyceraldehyde-3-phosphate dehydrogenase (NADP+)